MIRRLLAAIVVFAFAGACVFGAASAANSQVSMPQLVTSDSACPATGCANGSCHTYDAIPEPDGISELVCPESGCASVECHAWDTLNGRYHQASDASMNVWILAPAVLAALIVLAVRKG